MDAEAIAGTIASRMRDLREVRGLSLQAVADRAGIAKSHAWEIEQGRSRNPTIATAVGIARALGVSLDYLVGLSSSQPNMHPEALRIAGEIDVLLRRAAPGTEARQGRDVCGSVHDGPVTRQGRAPDPLTTTQKGGGDA